jgi:hypothetical protein
MAQGLDDGLDAAQIQHLKISQTLGPIKPDEVNTTRLWEKRLSSAGGKRGTAQLFLRSASEPASGRAVRGVVFRNFWPDTAETET